MASKQNLRLIHNFKGALLPIYESVLDLQKFGEMHPNMKSVKIIRTRPNEFVEYEIDEEVKFFGMIKLKPQYTAQVFEIDQNKHVQYFSQVEKNVFLTINFMFTEDINSGTVQIIEEAEVTANKFIGTIFLNILKKAHLQVFENLRKAYSSKM